MVNNGVGMVWFICLVKKIYAGSDLGSNDFYLPVWASDSTPFRGCFLRASWDPLERSFSSILRGRFPLLLKHRSFQETGSVFPIGFPEVFGRKKDFGKNGEGSPLDQFLKSGACGQI